MGREGIEVRVHRRVVILIAAKMDMLVNLWQILPPNGP